MLSKNLETAAIVFPGSGSQYVGMGKKLYTDFDVFKKTIDEANDVLGYDLKSICFDGSVIKLNRIENLLAAIFSISVATYRVFREVSDIVPKYMLGHSLGEYTALCCSNAIDFASMLKIVKKRSELAKKAEKLTNGTMSVAMNIDLNIVDSLCNDAKNAGRNVCIACYNSDRQVMISGTEEDVRFIEKSVVKNGGEVIPLIGSAPYHSPLFECILDEFKDELSKYSFKASEIPVVSNVSANIYSSSEDIVDGLIKQMTNPVLWKKLIINTSPEVDCFIDIGPNNILKVLINEIDEFKNVFSFDDRKDRETISRNINEPSKKDEYRRICKYILAITKNKNTNSEEYKKVFGMYNEITDMLISDEIMYDDVNKLMDSILEAKKVSDNERKKYNDMLNMYI